CLQRSDWPHYSF
nr:immunoglobulin light chain junction region [Macaca mulatta]MOW62011.1 immunoglobulin light chain junction region [Macaca mulatta]MOW62079.1 immunoglobulin light chain junction region [Macaca mulatta]MOW62325.1 immunoglobulin light chain junction region [Macaca mulatta]MOW62611.1 immunoglobulin light chain junction region [Macaca mulatta]